EFPFANRPDTGEPALFAADGAGSRSQLVHGEREFGSGAAEFRFDFFRRTHRHFASSRAGAATGGTDNGPTFAFTAFYRVRRQPDFSAFFVFLFAIAAAVDPAGNAGDGSATGLDHGELLLGNRVEVCFDFFRRTHRHFAGTGACTASRPAGEFG